MKLEIGLKFKSKWYAGITEILAINEGENTLEVEIHRSTNHSHKEEWNLNHAMLGFERGEYSLVNQI